jgi:hypothetical protein
MSQSSLHTWIVGRAPTWLNIFFQSILVFEVEDLPSYYINRPKISDVLVYKVNLEEHMWGVKVLPYTGCMKGLIFAN